LLAVQQVKQVVLFTVNVLAEEEFQKINLIRIKNLAGISKKNGY